MSGTVERAFELAPKCKSMKELTKRLVKEGLPDVHGHLQGSTIRKELHRQLGNQLADGQSLTRVPSDFR